MPNEQPVGALASVHGEHHRSLEERIAVGADLIVPERIWRKHGAPARLEWTARWEGVHQIWMVELLYWLQPRLPAEYRAYIGTTPMFAIDVPADARPDVGVRDQPAEEGVPSPAADAWQEPDEELAVAAIPEDKAVPVERAGRLVAAVELVSPCNKDRPSACAAYASGYVGYLLKGVHLLVVDVHRLPLRFSFAEWIAEELEFEQTPCPPPVAISYRVGERAPTGGRFLAVWRRPLVVGEPLPQIPLALSVHEAVSVDLEQTYARAAAAAYLQ